MRAQVPSIKKVAKTVANCCFAIEEQGSLTEEAFTLTEEAFTSTEFDQFSVEEQALFIKVAVLFANNRPFCRAN
jgi:hypothetical protein